VPAKRPVEESKFAQLGRFEIVNVRMSPSASVAFGVNDQLVPTEAIELGVPEIIGIELTIPVGGLLGTAPESALGSVSTGSPSSKQPPNTKVEKTISVKSLIFRDVELIAIPLHDNCKVTRHDSNH